MSFKLTILGCSSALPDVDRHPTAQLLNVNERFFLIDCGEGTQVQLSKFKLSFQRINHIFISHLHGDHYFGLIGLINSMHLLGRNKDLHIYAHYELKEIIELQLQSSDIELNYPLFFHPLPENNETILFEDGNIRISNIILNHSIKCVGFLFEEKTFKRKLITSKMDKYRIPHDKINSLRNGADWVDNTGKVISNELLTEENLQPHRYAYCTDTRYSEDLIDKVMYVDLLYHETTFMSGLEKRAEQTGHSTTMQAAKIAKKAKVNNLLIGHYSKRYRDLNKLFLETKKNFVNTILSYPGLLIDFNKIKN